MYSENSNQTMNQVVYIFQEIKNNQWKIVKQLSPRSRVVAVDYKRWLFMKGSNCRLLLAKIWCLDRWLLMGGGCTWFDCRALLKNKSQHYLKGLLNTRNVNELKNICLNLTLGLTNRIFYL